MFLSNPVHNKVFDIFFSFLQTSFLASHLMPDIQTGMQWKSFWDLQSVMFETFTRRTLLSTCDIQFSSIPIHYIQPPASSFESKSIELKIKINWIEN